MPSASPSEQAGGGPVSRTLADRISRSLAWLVQKALGFAIAVPMACRLALQVLRRPGLLFQRGVAQEPLPDPLPGLHHEWVKVNGVNLHLVRTCANPGGAKPVLLLLHGFPEGWFSWRHQMAAFRGRYSVVAMDLRGYGDSDKPKGVAPYRIKELAADVAGVIRAVAPPRSGGQVALVGHDFGGFLAWVTAHLHPELVSRVAVMCAPHPECFAANADWDQFKRSWYIFAFQAPWVPEAALTWDRCAMVGELLCQPPVGCRNPLPPEDVERYRRAFGAPGVARAAVNYYRAYLDSTTWAEDPTIASAVRRKLQMPALLLWADEDTALGPQLLRGVERYAERIRIQTLQNCSHWMQQDRPEEVNQLLKEFLE